MVLSSQRESAAKLAGIDPGRMAIPRQRHDNRVNYVASPGSAGECDGLVTDRPDVVLSIKVADCVPVFLHATDAGPVGLVHAGWRGTARNIVVKALEEMSRLFGSRPESIEVFMGPSIRACCYEVRDNVASLFPSEFWIAKEPHRFFLDLQKVNRLQLESSGVMPPNIAADERCTSCDGEGFHSHRRDGAESGRMVCLMGLE